MPENDDGEPEAGSRVLRPAADLSLLKRMGERNRERLRKEARTKAEELLAELDGYTRVLSGWFAAELERIATVQRSADEVRTLADELAATRPGAAAPTDLERRIDAARRTMNDLDRGVQEAPPTSAPDPDSLSWFARDLVSGSGALDDAKRQTLSKERARD